MNVTFIEVYIYCKKISVKRFFFKNKTLLLLGSSAIKNSRQLRFYATVIIVRF